MFDISFDLETLGKKYNSFITSIGAAEFNINTGEIIDTFYQRIDLSKSQPGRIIDGDTVKWWFKQGPDAQSAFTGDKGLYLHVALANLSYWMEDKEGVRVWGNGATFDISILEHAYQTHAADDPPWKFWNIQDMRTILRVAEELTSFDKGMIKREGTHHNALDDAVHQASVISGAYMALGRGK